MALRRHALGLTVLLYVSPLVGLLVELALARTFGASAVVDAYRIAAMLLVYGSGLLTETVLRNAVIPTVAQYRALADHRGAWRFAWVFSAGFIMLVMPLIMVILLWPDRVLSMLGPGLTAQGLSAGRLLISVAAVGLVLRLLAGGLAGGLAGALQSYGVFWAPPMSQAALNLALFIAIVTVGLAWQAYALAAAMMLGVATGLLFHVIATFRLAHGEAANRTKEPALRTSAALRSAIFLSLPLLVVAACQQWQSIIIARTLTQVGEGALALYGYGEKLMQLGALPAVAFVTVLYPVISDLAAKGASSELPQRFLDAWRYLLFMTLPLTVAIALTAEDIVMILFGRSALSAAELVQLTELCRIQAFTIPVIGMFVFLRQFIYALRRTLAATVAFLLMAGAYTVLLPWTASYGGLIAVPATHIVLLAGFDALALFYLAQRLRIHFSKGFLQSVAAMIAAISIAALAGYAVTGLLANEPDRNVVFHLAHGGMLSILVAASFLAICHLFKLPEAAAAIQFLRSLWARWDSCAIHDDDA